MHGFYLFKKIIFHSITVLLVMLELEEVFISTGKLGDHTVYSFFYGN